MVEEWFDQELWNDNFEDFDDEDLLEIIEEATEDIKLLIQSLHSDEPDVIAKSAHKIISVCGNFGFLHCASLAAGVEQKSKAGTLINDEKQRLIEMTERVISELHERTQ